MTDEGHGLTVADLPRPAATGAPAVTEPHPGELPASNLSDLRDTPLAEIAAAETLRRIAPRHGALPLAVAAFQSYI
jgi:FXSXX-COOH protein